MDGTMGEICKSPADLKKTATQRKRDYQQTSVSKGRVAELIPEGWGIWREGKSRTRLRKPKSLDERFEDRVWHLFYNLKFDAMNKDRKFKLDLGTYSKQIDVFAKDPHNVFVIECKGSNEDGPINAKSALEEFNGKREDIQKASQAQFGRNSGRLNIVIALSSQEKRPVDEEYARDKNIFLWSAKEIQYIEELIEQVGPVAKYQLYSIIFADKKQKSLGMKCPALKGKIASRTFYTFLISAKQLLKYSYVHHRKLTGIVETSQVYQRMLRRKKLRDIARFIDGEDGYFANSIIVNFRKPPRWDLVKSESDSAMGFLHMPEYYGSAWIIDGQHRLYGAAQAQTDVMLPVLAFECMEEMEQANLFVEINEKQTSVQANLLWDLYSDIYRDSSDEKQKFLYEVTETAKELNAINPLKGYVEIPSAILPSTVKLTLTTVCDAIRRCTICWDYLRDITDPSKAAENAARLISAYFDVLKSLWPEDWQQGNNGVILTNNGFGVFMLLFRDIIRDISNKAPNPKQVVPLLRSHKTNDFKELLTQRYMTPAIEYLKKDSKLQNDIKTKTGRGPQDTEAGILELQIQEFVQGFWSPLVDRSPQIVTAGPPPMVSTVENKALYAEKVLRSFVLENLKRVYGNTQWWKQGLPGDIKKEADERWSADIKRKPYLQSRKATNEDKFVFLDLGRMMNIIIYGQNWDPAFKDTFGDKGNLQRRIKDVMVLRNPVSHARNPDDQDVLDGTSGLRWLSECIGEPDLNPYV